MTHLEAVAIVGRTARIIASVHGVLSAEEARRYEEAQEWLSSYRKRLRKIAAAAEQALRRIDLCEEEGAPLVDATAETEHLREALRENEAQS